MGRKNAVIAATFSAAMACLVLGACGSAPSPGAAPAHAQASDPGEVDARRKDLAALRTGFLEQDKAFTNAARAEAGKRLAALEADPGKGSDAAFVVELMRIVALADNGHTSFGVPPRVKRFNRIDIRLSPFGEDFYVVRAADAATRLLGGRLVAIDGHDIVALRRAERELAGGIASWRDRSGAYLFESPDQLHAMGLAKDAGHARYEFIGRDGRRIALDLVAAPAGGSAPLLRPSRLLDPSPVAGETGWRTLLAPDKAPWSLTGAGGPSFRWRDAPEIDALVVELQQMTDAPDRKITDFLNDAEAERVKLGRRNVVLDLRRNGGGNLTLTHAFFAKWPEMIGPQGRIAVLTSPWTFSAAISGALYLKQAGGERVVLVGEAPGDRLEFWSEGKTLTLPSGLDVGVQRQRHDYKTGCQTQSDCHGFIKMFPIKVASPGPDISAPWTIEAYAAGRDPGMEAVAKLFAPH